MGMYNGLKYLTLSQPRVKKIIKPYVVSIWREKTLDYTTAITLLYVNLGIRLTLHPSYIVNWQIGIPCSNASRI